MSMSAGPDAVRDAVTAVVSHWAARPSRSTDDLIDRLVAAVEAVPVKVTIRDLDMADSENIVTIRDGDDLDYLRQVIDSAFGYVHEPLHLTVDGGCLKVKVGWGSWSAPIRTEVYEP